MKTNFTVLLATLALCGAMGIGCLGNSSPPPPGQVSVTYQFGLQSCEDKGLVKINVRLFNEGGQVIAQQTESCRDGGSKSITLSNVPQGVYRLEINGLNEENIATYRGNYPDGSLASDTDNWLVVESGQLAAVRETVNLTARKGGIYLGWKFANADLCSFNGVSDVRVIIYDKDSEISVDKKYPCDPTVLAPQSGDDVSSGSYIESKRGVYIAELRQGSTDLIVQGLDPLGSRLWQGTHQFDIESGIIKDIKITLEDCSEINCQ